jgi:methionyl-tRNA formyltransferase
VLRLLFFGTPAFAVPSLDALFDSPHQVVGVVTQPDKPRGRGQQISASPVKQRADAHGVPVFQPMKLRDETYLEAMRALRADLGVVAAYGKLLPESLLEIPRLGMVNVHASVLPRYRGAAPIQRAIIDGATDTGVTIMRVVKALDAGPMLLADWVPIGPTDTNVDVEARLATLGAGLLLSALDQLERGTAVEISQDDAKATYASRIEKADGLIDWEQPAQAIHDRVRALHPWPHAYTFLDGARYVIHESRPHPSIAAASSGLAEELQTAMRQRAEGAWPGTILLASKGALLVSAGMGSALEIRQLQEEGRRVMDTRAFLAGRPLQAGRRFTAYEEG